MCCCCCVTLMCCCLNGLGFGREGVRGNSWASGVQPPDVASGSAFATSQSLGATGTMGVWGGILALLYGLVFLATVLAMGICLLLYFTKCQA